MPLMNYLIYILLTVITVIMIYIFLRKKEQKKKEKIVLKKKIKKKKEKKNESKIDLRKSDQDIYGYNNKNNENGKGNIKGTDVTYHVGDLLKYTEEEVKYNGEGLEPYREDIEGVPGAFLVYNLLTKEECDQYINIATNMGFEQSPLRDLSKLNSEISNLTNESLQIRNSERVLFDVPDSIGLTLNKRLFPFLDEKVNCIRAEWEVVKIGEGEAKGPINRRWRFNRYKKGQYFKPHFDAGYVYNDKEQTIFTFILYLSEGFEGGETIFYPDDKRYSWSKKEEGIEVKIKPQIGMALIFFQAGNESPRHCGATQLSDEVQKHILRSDLAYKMVE